MSRTQKGMLGWNLIMGGAASRRTAAFILSLGAVSGAYGGITGQTVVQGSATFIPTSTGWKIVASNGAIINYNAFSVASGERIKFVQPSADSRVLNRILGDFPTHIDGRLTANGILYIVNPAGVYIGSSGVVNVGGLYAAAGKMSNEDFNAGAAGGATPGQSRFTGLVGKVSNAGTINATTEAHLVGASVVNSGTISVGEAGYLTMVASTGTVRIIKNGMDPQIFVDVQISPNGDDPGATTGVLNSGTVETGAGGQILMGAGDLYAIAIRNSGSSSVSAPDGIVTFKGDMVVQQGALSTGQLNVEANEFHVKGTVGADVVTVSGDVALEGATTFTGQSGQATSVTFEGATFSVDQPRDLTIDAHTFVAKESVGAQDAQIRKLNITGDATFGGDVIAMGDVLIEGKAKFDGADQVASTEGGLTINGKVSKSTAGSLSLLGESLTLGADIVQSGGDLLLTASGTTDSQGGGVIAIGGNLSASGSAVLEAAQIKFVGAAEQSAEAGVDLSFNGDVSKDTGDLSLTAGEVLGLNGTVEVPDGSLDATAGERIILADDVIADQAISLTAPSVVFDGPGSQLVSAGSAVSIAGDVSKTAGTLSVDGDSVEIFGRVEVDAGDISVNASQGLSIAGDVDADGTVDLSAGGELLLGGDITAGSAVSLTGFSISFSGLAAQKVSAGDSLELTGDATKGSDDLTLSAGTTITLNDSVQTGGSLEAIASGLLTIGENIAAGGFVSLSGNGIQFSSTGSQSVDAGTDMVLTGDIAKSGGLLELNATENLTIGGMVELGGDLAAAAGQTLSIASNLKAGGNVALTGSDVQFSSTDDQTLSIGANLSVSGAVTKESGSLDLEVGGALDLGSDVTVVGDLKAMAGDALVIGGDIDVGGAAILAGDSIDFDGAGSQSVMAGSSLLVDGMVSKATGSLSFTTTAEDGVLTLTGDEIHVSGGSATLDAALIEFVNDGAQLLEVNGDLDLLGDVRKEVGDLSINAGGDLLADGRADAVAGSLSITAGGELTLNDGVSAAVDLTLGAGVAASEDGLGAGLIVLGSDLAQSLTADGNVSILGGVLKETGDIDVQAGLDLTATGLISALEGNVELSALGGTLSLGGDVNAGGDVSLAGGSGIEFTHLGTQSVTAGMSLALHGDTTKLANSLVLDAGQQLTMDGNLSVTEGDLLVSASLDASFSGDVEAGGAIEVSAGAIVFNGAAGQSVTAGIDPSTTGDLTLDGPVLKSVGDLALSADGNVDLTGPLSASTGSLSIEAGGTLTLLGDAFAGESLSLGGERIELDGEQDQTLEAGNDLIIVGDLTKTSGDLDLRAIDNTMTLDGDIAVENGELVAKAGSTLSVLGDIATEGLTWLTASEIEFSGSGMQSVFAGGKIKLDGPASKIGGDLLLSAQGDIVLHGDLSGTDDLDVSSDGAILIANDISSGGSTSLSATAIHFTNGDAQAIEAGDNLTLKIVNNFDGAIQKASGDLTLTAAKDLALLGLVELGLDQSGGETSDLAPGNLMATASDGELAIASDIIVNNGSATLDGNTISFTRTVGDGAQAVVTSEDLTLVGHASKAKGDLRLDARDKLTATGSIELIGDQAGDLTLLGETIDVEGTLDALNVKVGDASTASTTIGGVDATEAVTIQGELIDVSGSVKGQVVKMFGEDITVDGLISGKEGILLAKGPAPSQNQDPAAASKISLGGDLESKSGDIQLWGDTVDLTGVAATKWAANKIEVSGDITGEGKSLTLSATDRVDLAGSIGEAGKSLAAFTLEKGALSFLADEAAVYADTVSLEHVGEVQPVEGDTFAHIGASGSLLFETSSFTMDQDLILSSVGQLKITANTATLSSLNSGGDMIVDADTIKVQSGANFVTLGLFDFSETPIAANGSNETFEFASAASDADLRGTLANEPAIALRLLPAGSYTSESLTVSIGGLAWFLDLVPQGPTTSSTATTLAAVAPQDLESQRESDSVSLNPEDRDALSRILGARIELRDPSAIELGQLARGYVTFVDTPIAGSPIDAVQVRLPVAVARLGSTEAVQLLVQAEAGLTRLHSSDGSVIGDVAVKLETAYQSRATKPTALYEVAAELMDRGSEAERAALLAIVGYVVGGESLGLSSPERARVAVQPGWPQIKVTQLSGADFTVPASAFDASFRRLVQRSVVQR